MDLIYTDVQRRDVGVLKNFTLDLAFGSDENDFELTMDLQQHCCEMDGLIYIENTEYGGIIDGLGVTTAEDKLSYVGRTWHGILASKVIVPDEGEAYLTMSGDANEIIGSLIERCGLSSLFVASSELSDLVFEGYSFDRYIDLYSGIKKMLGSVSGKLKCSFVGGMVVLSAIKAVDYSKDEQFDQSYMSMVFSKTKNVVNHLICLGKGELADRVVIHLYRDENGNIGSTQSIFGLQEVTAIYDYPNAESEEDLMEKGLEVFAELASEDKVEMDFSAEDDTYDVGDTVGAREIVTGTVATSKITKKIVTIRENEVNIQYKVGE